MGNFHIPTVALTHHVAIVGKTGSGKTYTAKGVVEDLLKKGRRVCIVDPLGVWWGLRSSGGGVKAGLHIPIIGGDHADVRIGVESGTALGKMIAEGRFASVVDTSEFGITERKRFMTDFLTALYKHNRSPIFLVLDEADELAPQQPMPDSRTLLNRTSQIIQRGRVRGFRVTMITQRPAVIHKNVLSQLGTLVAMKVTAPQDRKAIESWIEGNADKTEAKEVLTSLARLGVGEGWIWYPAADYLERGKFPMIETFDSSRTPDDDDEPAEPRRHTRLSKGDAEDLQRKLDDAASPPAEADPATLNRRRLKEVRAIAYESGFRDARSEIAACVAAATEAIREFGKRADEILAQFESTAPRAGGRSDANAADELIARIDGMIFEPEGDAEPDGAANLTGPQRQLLGALAWWSSVGNDAPTRPQAAVIAGWRVTGGHLKNVSGSLRTLGLIEYRSEKRLALTREGLNIAPREHAHTSVVEKVKAILTGPQRLAFGALMNADRLSRDALAEACNWDPGGGHVKNVLGGMRTLGIVDYPQPGQVKLSNWVTKY